MFSDLSSDQEAPKLAARKAGFPIASFLEPLKRAAG